MNRIIISILILLTFVSNASASDSVFGTYDNKVFKDTSYTIVINDPVQSSVLFDDDNSYFYTKNYLYSSNKNNGTINYKIKIQASDMKLSINYIYVVSGIKIYKINKNNGTIDSIFSKNQDVKIYTEDVETLDQISFAVQTNNTNLAPNVAGHPIGSGERIQGVTYYTNLTPIELHVFAHADTAAQALMLNLSINGTEIQKIQLRPLTSPENTHAPITAIIPRYANYSVSISNYHHYEWREYPIIPSNSTIIYNINNNYTNITGVSDNLKINKSGDTMTGNLNMSDNKISNVVQIGKYLSGETQSNIQFLDSVSPAIIVNSIKDSNNLAYTYNSWFQFYWFNYYLGNLISEFTIDSSGMYYIYKNIKKFEINETGAFIGNDLDMNRKNITNCLNCVPKISVQNSSTNHTFNTVYQNTKSVPIYVAVSFYASDTTCYLYSDSSNPPTTLIVSMASALNVYDNLFGIILSNNYYKIDCNHAGTVVSWVEWN